MKTIKILLIILLVVIGAVIFYSIQHKQTYSNSPCYYFVSNDEVKLDGINSSQVDMYQNEEGNFFFLTKENQTQIPECQK